MSKVTYLAYQNKKSTSGWHRSNARRILLRKRLSSPSAAFAMNTMRIFSHFVTSCPSMSDNMYLYQRHDRVANIVYEEIIYKHTDAENNRKHIIKPPKVTKLKGKEIWWNVSINLPIKVGHNRPDIGISDYYSKVCTLVEVCTPLDANVTNRTAWKVGLYFPLVCEVSRIYPGYHFQIVPVVMGALGAVPQSQNESMKKLNIEENRIRPVTRRIQIEA